MPTLPSQASTEPTILLFLTGRITLDEGRRSLRREIARLLAQGQRRFALDLSGVSYLDSAGLGELIACQIQVRRKGGSLAAVNPTDKIRELLRITQADRMLARHSCAV